MNLEKLLERAHGSGALRVALAFALAALAVGPLSAKPVEAIAFRGKVTDMTTSGSSEGKMVTLDFKLYTSSAADGELLWARRVPVSLDAEGSFYVELADTTGQSYQSTDGRTPLSDTLAGAFAEHSRRSEGGPVWIGYSPVDAKVTSEPERDGIYYQPVAIHALSSSYADIARVKDLTAKTVNATAPMFIDKLVSDTTLINASDLKIYKKNQNVTLNESGSVRLKTLSGFQCAQPDEDGNFEKVLPAKADGDCGRVVRRTLTNGETTHETIFYTKGDSTTAPADSKTIYIWTFGKLEAN